MGTSSPYKGLTGGGWTYAKSLMTRFARSGGDRESLGRAVDAYVAAHGGARLAAAGAAAGQAAVAALGGFLVDVVHNGLPNALEKRGLAYLIGQDVDNVLASLVDALAGSGATREEAITRAAMAEVLGDLFERLAETPDGLAALESFDAAGIAEVIELFTTEYIYQRMLEEIGDCIETGALTPEIAERLENQIRNYIREMVRLELSDVDVLDLEWAGPEGEAFRERIFRSAYALLEG